MGKTFRYIDPKLRQSESVSKLTYRQRDLWIRLILSVDDQGRCLANPSLIRSMVWPLDDISIQDVQEDLEVLDEKKFILLYEVEEKNYLQIVNWREYQSQSEWLGPSQYPAPVGWKDRFRYHGKGNGIVKSDNWATFSKGRSLPTRLPFNDGDVKEESKTTFGEGSGEGSGEGRSLPSRKVVDGQKTRKNTTSTASPVQTTNSFSQENFDPFAMNVFTRVTQMVAIPGSQAPQVLAAIEALRKERRTESEMVEYLKPYFEVWATKFNKSNCAWLTDWAVAGEIPNQKKKSPTSVSDRNKEILNEAMERAENGNQ